MHSSLDLVLQAIEPLAQERSWRELEADFDSFAGESQGGESLWIGGVDGDVELGALGDAAGFVLGFDLEWAAAGEAEGGVAEVALAGLDDIPVGGGEDLVDVGDEADIAGEAGLVGGGGVEEPGGLALIERGRHADV